MESSISGMIEANLENPVALKRMGMRLLSESPAYALLCFKLASSIENRDRDKTET